MEDFSMSKLFETYNKFNELKTDTKVRVFCRICYANIWEAKSILGSEPKFSVSCLFDKDDKDTIALIQKAIDAAKEQGKSKCWGGKIPTGSSFKLPLHDGDVDRADDEAYEGMMYVNATSKDAPQIVGRKKQPITDPMEVGSGDYCMVTINFYPFNANGASKGVAAGLSNIQLAAHGERLSGRVSADKDFDELPGDDDDVLGGELPDFI